MRRPLDEPGDTVLHQRSARLHRGYYSENLAAERLQRCYDVAPPAAREYLEAEVAFAASRVGRDDVVLELGCGYGRVMKELAPGVRSLVGIDNSLASLRMARRNPALAATHLTAMNALHLGFRNETFDAVICIQNGISAFGVDRTALLTEAARVTRAGGLVLFSSYAESFWPERLAWFEAQATHGLIGEIDHDATGGGVIVCKDGFRAATVRSDEFRDLADRMGLVPRIVEVARSSLFCEMTIPERAA